MVDPAQVKYVEIFPPIGIARFGNSDAKPNEDYFIGPEIPDEFSIPSGGFKDRNGKIRRQAARFRVYGYNSEGKVLGELNQAAGYSLKWTADVANSKAAFHRFYGKFGTPKGLRNPTVQNDLPIDQRNKLIIRSCQSVQGANKTSPELKGTFQGSRPDASSPPKANSGPVPIYLGELRTDEHGRLIFLGGKGFSHSTRLDDEQFPMITSEFNSDDWVDDACDGSITVSVTHGAWKSTEPLTPAYPAWVVCGPPKFGWAARAPTSLYDLIEEVYEQPKRKTSGYQVEDPKFYPYIWNIFECTWSISWLNTHAQAGHGANVDPLVRGYNFLDKETMLANPGIDSLRERQNVFKYMRVPTSPKYEEYREAQASAKFMPRLSGDAGDIPETPSDSTTNLVNRFSSLTELQYDRLHKWALGKFKPGEKIRYKTLDDIPFHLQPAALTRSALEWTIGSPLFPGIEMYWKAEQTDWYEPQPRVGNKPLDPPFRIRSTVQPGDLTQNLSMPWQSDFYLCNVHWWPSTRPDDVVTREIYNSVQPVTKPEDLAAKLIVRESWTRGLRDDDPELTEGQPFLGNYDMALHWHELAFMAPVNYDEKLAVSRPIYVEGRRDVPSAHGS